MCFECTVLAESKASDDGEDVNDEEQEHDDVRHTPKPREQARDDDPQLPNPFYERQQANEAKHPQGPDGAAVVRPYGQEHEPGRHDAV